MKRLSIIQIIAGLLLIASWFVYINLIEPGYYRMYILDIDGIIICGYVISPLRAVTPALVIWTAGYPVLGILVTGCGISRLIRNFRGLATKKLDIAQIVFGVLVLALMILYVTGYEPHIQVIQGFPGAAEVRHDPGWVAGMNVWKIVSFVTGPVVAATGGWPRVKRKETEETGI